MIHFVTGGAGFIGSNLCDRLLENRKDKVIVYDNFSSGKHEFLKDIKDNPNLKIVKGDLLDVKKLERVMKGVDVVWHLAANPDVRVGAHDTKVHIEQNVMATYNVVEAMRRNGVGRIMFTSTSTVYGEASVIPTGEDYGPCVPISLYGASKLAAEALISSYCYTFGMSCVIYRFANCVGRRGTHGVIFDFVNKLRRNPRELEILGDGRQNKSYFLVENCVDAMIHTTQLQKERVEIYNVGSADMITVTELADIVVSELGLKDVKFRYTGGVDGGRGWRGDVKTMQLSVEKLAASGYKLKHNSKESVQKTVRVMKSTLL
ncbi:MAG: NAD-dependent epimerase/dehydratase family protein [archaeon]|nr:NAD-dependent epimerase/dehydratase family protein [archaeon]